MFRNSPRHCLAIVSRNALASGFEHTRRQKLWASARRLIGTLRNFNYQTVPSAMLLLLIVATSTFAQNKPLDDEGRVVDFARDIAPILREKCLECHGPEDAKNDFRVDDPEIMGDYIDAGDAESSSLFAEYIAASGDDFEDYLMPPTSKGGPLPAHEIALIKLWLDEGAEWPEGVAISREVASEEVPTENASEVERGFASRAWIFQGYFHPATVHFPVALFLFGGIFVVLGYKWPELAHPIPIACLIGGALSSIGATVMGVAFAEVKGYGSVFKGLEFTSSRHGMAGILVTVLAVVFALIAVRAELKKDEKLRKVWRAGLLLCAMLVGLVGHIGGELTYGEEFYDKAFQELIGSDSEQGGAMEEAK